MDKKDTSFGFSTYGYSQIILFSNEEDFRKIVDANSNMTAIIGADDHTKNLLPGVFLAGIKRNERRISISGDPKEIADLVLALQGQQNMDVIKKALVELGLDPQVLRKS